MILYYPSYGQVLGYSKGAWGMYDQFNGCTYKPLINVANYTEIAGSSVTSTFDSTRSLLYQLAPVQSDNTQVLLVIDTAAWKVDSTFTLAHMKPASQYLLVHQASGQLYLVQLLDFTSTSISSFDPEAGTFTLVTTFPRGIISAVMNQLDGHILLTVSDSLNPFTVYGLDPRAPTVLYRVVMQVAHKAPFGAAVGPV